MTFKDSILSLSENQELRSCLKCGKPLSRDQKSFCSKKCFYDSVRRSKEICRFCGKEYFPKAVDRITYCSKSCYYAHKTQKRISKENYNSTSKTNNRKCIICGKVFTGKTNVIYCSDECRREKERRRRYIIDSSKKEARLIKCKYCGLEFIPIYGDQRRSFCSANCGRKYNRRGNKNNRKKARKYNVLYEPIDPIKVFNRDGWACQICGKPTPEKNRGSLYSNAPEMDHRIPMSKGGDHLYSNVQCVCRKCNGKKSNHNNAGYIPLFGVGSVELTNEAVF